MKEAKNIKMTISNNRSRRWCPSGRLMDHVIQSHRTPSASAQLASRLKMARKVKEKIMVDEGVK
jgi:hypothetical protein